ncbi:hypothetical protein GH714_024236 [Hevea brasiliensis]|uniref:Zinc finger PMZ-type domain-containing protein n=1 Tax=Hevea brasiliensis TaxID=3981 RepID=A0A6A6LAX1_HEVBR|nr:hypothetical protein GH714_024236 [Hevea brasiliensis]
MWDLSRIPCKHSISAIYANEEKPEDYGHSYYLKYTCLAVYKHVRYPVPSKEEWERTKLNDIYPPIVRKTEQNPERRELDSLTKVKGNISKLQAHSQLQDLRHLKTFQEKEPKGT